MDSRLNVAVERGMTELDSMGIASHITLAQAEYWLHDGSIGQDEFDLYYDVWMSASFKYSKTESAIRDANHRLLDRYGL